MLAWCAVVTVIGRWHLQVRWWDRERQSGRQYYRVQCADLQTFDLYHELTTPRRRRILTDIVGELESADGRSGNQPHLAIPETEKWASGGLRQQYHKPYLGRSREPI